MIRGHSHDAVECRFFAFRPEYIEHARYSHVMLFIIHEAGFLRHTSHISFAFHDAALISADKFSTAAASAISAAGDAATGPAVGSGRDEARYLHLLPAAAPPRRVPAPSILDEARAAERRALPPSPESSFRPGAGH